jgi:cyclase
MRVIAKLDVKTNLVVKPVHFEGLRKMGWPDELARKYYAQGVDEIFYMDIVASLYQRGILFERIEATAQEFFVPFAVGGGIRTIDDMTRLFHIGADKVVINTHALQHDASLIDRAARLFGAQSVVVSVEAKRWQGYWECYSDCGRERSGRDVLEWVQEAQERGAGELLIQSVDQDGRQAGFDIDLIGEVKQRAQVPVVAASGAGTLEHIVEMAKAARPDAVAVASLLHYDICDVAAIKNRLAGELNQDAGQVA